MTPALIAALDWPRIAADLDCEGYALLPALLSAQQFAALRTHARTAVLAGAQAALPGLASASALHWHTAATLPAPVPACLHAFHRHLAPIADQWAAHLATPPVPPDAQGHVAFSRLLTGADAPLRQHIHGAPAFALQLVILLSAPGADFTGGQFVMTEQRPRMQSRPMVLPLESGDAALIAVSRRPVRGARGHYQVNASHAISRVRSGERLGMECLFHDPIGTATFRP
jgi:hypothetical protein